MRTDCVLLAAGQSSRMGKNKMTLALGGRTVIERCMDAFYDACSRIIVVTGKYHEDIQQCLAPYSKVHIVYHQDYSKGMFSSVKAGIRHVRAERFFVTPGDYPFLQVDTVHRMLHACGCFAQPYYQGRQGHPVLLDKLFIPHLLNSTCPSLRDCLQLIPAKSQEVPVDDIGVVTDIDTLEDYRAQGGTMT